MGICRPKGEQTNMAKTLQNELTVSREKMAAYRATMERRGREKRVEWTRRRERAWKVAQQAADILRTQFDATRVVVFGSLARGTWFSGVSDIDLAAWGVKDEDYFTAVARLQDLSPEFKIDLIAMERCKPALRTTILREGKLV